MVERHLKILAVLLFAIPGVSHSAPHQVVDRGLVQVRVEKVIRIQLAKEQPADPKLRTVSIEMQANYDRCGAGETYSFAEGKLDKLKYISFWAIGQSPCSSGGPVDLSHHVTLAVGENAGFVFRGTKKFDQRVSFRVDKTTVASTMIKKVRSR